MLLCMHAFESRLQPTAWRGHSAGLKAPPATTRHTYTYTHARTPPERSYGTADCMQTPLPFTSDSFCWSLNASFPFGLSRSPLSLRLLMIGTSMSSACIFHSLSWLTSSSAGGAYLTGGELRLAPHQEEHRLPSSSWRSPPPPPPAADAAAPLVCLVVCPCAPEKAELESHDSRKLINYSHKVSKLKVGGYSTMLHLMPKLENVKLPEQYYRVVDLAWLKIST